MRRPLVCAGLVAAMVLGCVHTPIAWSPDGRWLAFTAATRRIDHILAPGWIFGDDPAPDVAAPKVAAEVTYRLWATRPDTGATVLLERSPGPLTSPGWGPAGTALAFGRLVPEAEGRARFEIVVQEAPDRQRVLRREALAESKGEAAGLPALAIAWSPDGHMLAAPQLQPRGLVILRVDDGRVLKSIDEAYLPSWAPEGGKLAYYRGGTPEGLFCLDARLGEPRLLSEIPQPVLAPAWSHDGRTVWALRRRPTGQVDLLRVGAEGEGVDIFKSLFEPDADHPDQAPLSASFAVDRTGQDLFFTTHVEGKPSEIVHQQLRNNAIHCRFNPVDRLVALGGLSVSPTGKWLALRVGPAGILGPPGFCDVETQKLTPLAPDDASRAEWLVTLIDGAQAILRVVYPAPEVAGRPVERPTLLPASVEPPRAPDGMSRLRHLANLARPLCDRPSGSGSAEPEPGLEPLLAEARLFFDYLRDDFDGALEALDALEPKVVGADRRLRLLALRAQILLAKGDTERARAAIAYLRKAQPELSGRYELTPDGPVLTPDPDPRAAWIAYLSARADERLGAARDRAVPTPGAVGPPALAPVVVPPAPRVVPHRAPFRLPRPIPPPRLVPPRPAPAPPAEGVLIDPF